MAAEDPVDGPAGTVLGAEDPTPTAPDPSAPQLRIGAEAQVGLGLAEQPKRGGIGGIFDAILKSLQPVRRATRRRTTRRASTTRRPTAATGGGRGTLLAIRYHSGATKRWTTTRVAFGRRGNRVAVISSSDAAWWHHIRNGSDVQIRVRNAWVDGRARLLSRDEDTYTRAVGIFVEDRSRAAAQRLGVPMDEHGHLDHGPRRAGDAVVVWIEVDAT